MPAEESPIERLFQETWHRRVPHIQLIREHKVFGGRYRLDFAYPPAKIAIELDGYDYHNSRDQFTHDRRRGRDLDRAGWRVLHFSGREINQDVVRCVNEVRQVIENTQLATAQRRPNSHPNAQRSISRRLFILLVATIPLALLLIGVSLLWVGRSAPAQLSRGDRTPTAASGRVTAQPAQIVDLATRVPPSPIRTATTQPSATITRPTPNAFPSGVVINGGNLRTEMKIATTTVIGQVCPGDTLVLLEQQQGNQPWYHIRITTLAASCHPQRVVAETEGWLSSMLVRLQE